jgi:hypothetical protein
MGEFYILCTVPSVIIFVMQYFHMQVPSSSLPLAAVIATNALLACIVHEAIQESLHEVCMRLPIVCPNPHVTLMMLVKKVNVFPSSSISATVFETYHTTTTHSIDYVSNVYSSIWCAQLGCILFCFL